MKLSTTIKFLPNHTGIDMEHVLEAERLGFDAVWAGEAYGTDAVSPVAWVLARTSRIKAGTSIMQMPARTPACAAMTAMTLQALSGNASCAASARPGRRSSKAGTAWRSANRSAAPANTSRSSAGAGAQGAARTPWRALRHPLCRPARAGSASRVRQHHPRRPRLRIYTASIAPAGLRVSGEVADGNLPFFMSPEKAEAVIGPTLEGRPDSIKRAGRSADLADFDNAPYVRVSMGEELAKCRDALRPGLALYIGGMGARSAISTTTWPNASAMRRPRSRSRTVFDGKRNEAAAAVPDALIDEISLIGPRPMIRDRLQAGRRSPARTGSARWCWPAPTPPRWRVIAEAVFVNEISIYTFHWYNS